jgi:hypothetical protein
MAAIDDLDLSRAAWRKSTYSNNGGACIEVASVGRMTGDDAGTRPDVAPGLVWQKSTHSGNGGSCVEVAGTGPAVAVRDSKNPGSPALAFTPAQWHAFTARLASARP